MSEQITLSTEAMNALPRRLLSTYVLWSGGENPREIMSKPTFYKHRKELLEYGIDINLPTEKANSSNVIPLVRVLEAKPVAVPEWAYTMGLIHTHRVA